MHEWLILRTCGWGDVSSCEALVMSLKTGGPKFDLCHPYKSRSWCHISAVVALGIQTQVVLWNALASQPSWPANPRFSIRPYFKGQSRGWLRKTSGIECWPPHIHTYVRAYPYLYEHIYMNIYTQKELIYLALLVSVSTLPLLKFCPHSDLISGSPWVTLCPSQTLRSFCPALSHRITYLRTPHLLSFVPLPLPQ